MTELTPEKLAAQEQAARKLRKLRQESETYFGRRDEAIKEADQTGMSLRAIGSNIGMSPQGVLNILNKLREAQGG